MSSASHIARIEPRYASASTGDGMLRTALRPRLLIWPILASIVLGAVGWYTNHVIERAQRKQVADRIETILGAEVEAAGIWLSEQCVDAELIVAAGPVLALARELSSLADASDTALRESSQQEALRSFLKPLLEDYGHTGYFLVARSGRIIASSDGAVVGKPMDGYSADFCRRVLGGKSAVSKPFRSPFAMIDPDGKTRAGVPTILAAAPIRGKDGNVTAALAIRIPEARFTKILRMARSGVTGETYAFDSSGLMLSESRFDDDLKRVGILPDAPDARSTLTVELRDPQVNLMAGERPTLSREVRPLTRMAADAVKGGSGIDVDGYRDYRGVKVVGAWKWLPAYDLGIATEMDVDEAYAPVAIVRTAFLGLFALSALGAAAACGFLIVVARQQWRMETAERMVKQLGQYTLEGKIGSGGMGSVYKARHGLLRRPTAIKMLNADQVSEEALARFEREVQLTSKLNHPNTIAIYDFGRTADGIFYYAMEYLEGIDLDRLAVQYGPQPVGRTLAILKQVSASLVEAHAGGLIHRDIKPANLLLTNRAGIPDFVKVLDFGLVKAMEVGGGTRLTATNIAVGTPDFMAPEAIEQPEAVTAAADIYAIGAVGYFLLTATPVFKGKTAMDVCMKHLKTTPEPVSDRLGRAIDPAVEAVILRCLAKKPEDRFPSTAALLEALSACPAQDWTAAEATAWWARFHGQRGAKSGA